MTYKSSADKSWRISFASPRRPVPARVEFGDQNEAGSLDLTRSRSFDPIQPIKRDCRYRGLSGRVTEVRRVVYTSR